MKGSLVSLGNVPRVAVAVQEARELGAVATTTEQRMTKLVAANIVSCFNASSVGTKVLDREGFEAAAVAAIEAYDFGAQRVPGQGFVQCPEAVPFVSAGVGRRTRNPEDFVLREYRGNVETFLRREHAAKVEGCALVVYTKDA